MYQNFYPYTCGYKHNNYLNRQFSDNEYNEYEIDYNQFKGSTIPAPATIQGYFLKGTRIFILDTYLNSAGQQMVEVVYPFQEPNTGVLSIGVSTFQSTQLGWPITPPTLRRGSSGYAVRVLQQDLIKFGYSPGPADGQFGPRTEQAVKGFQQDRNLHADGVVGPATWRALGRSWRAL